MIRFRAAPKPRSGYVADLIIDRSRRVTNRDGSEKRQGVVETVNLSANELIDFKVNARQLCDTLTCPNKATTNEHLCDDCQQNKKGGDDGNRF